MHGVHLRIRISALNTIGLEAKAKPLDHMLRCEYDSQKLFAFMRYLGYNQSRFLSGKTVSCPET